MSSSMNIAYTLSAIDKITPVLKSIEKLSKKVQASLKMTATVTANTQSARLAIEKLAKTPLKIHGVTTVDTSAIDAAISKANGAKATISVGTKGGFGGAAFGGGVGGGIGGGIPLPAIGWAAGAAAAGFAIKESVQTFADLETQQLGLAKALDLGLNSDALKKYTEQMRSLAKETGISETQLTDFATNFAKADGSLSPERLASLSKTAVAGSKAWDIELNTVITTMQSLKSTFNSTDAQLASSVDMIDLLSDKFGVLSEQYLLDFLATNSAVMASSGFAEKQILAFATAAGEAQVQAGEAGNMVKVLTKELSKVSATDLSSLGIDANVFKGLAKPEQVDAILMGMNNIIKKSGITAEQLDKLDATGRKNLFMEQGAKMGVDLSLLSSSIVGNNYDDALIRIASQYEKTAQAQDLLLNPKNYDGRALKGLSLEAETANGKFARLKETMMGGLADIGGALYEAFAGEWIMPLWNSIGGNFSRIFALFSDGSGKATGALDVLKFAVGGIAGAVKILATVFEVAFLAIKTAVELVINLFHLDFMGAIDTVSTRFNDFLNIFKLGSAEVDTKITSVQKTTAPVVAQALPNSPIGGMSYGAMAQVPVVAKPSPEQVAIAQAQATNTAKQTTSAQTLDMASKNILQASNVMLQAAQTPVKVQTTAVAPLAGLGDQGRG